MIKTKVVETIEEFDKDGKMTKRTVIEKTTEDTNISYGKTYPETYPNITTLPYLPKTTFDCTSNSKPSLH